MNFKPEEIVRLRNLLPKNWSIHLYASSWGKIKKGDVGFSPIDNTLGSSSSKLDMQALLQRLSNKQACEGIFSESQERNCKIFMEDLKGAYLRNYKEAPPLAKQDEIKKSEPQKSETKKEEDSSFWKNFGAGALGGIVSGVAVVLIKSALRVVFLPLSLVQNPNEV